MRGRLLKLDALADMFHAEVLVNMIPRELSEPQRCVVAMVRPATPQPEYSPMRFEMVFTEAIHLLGRGTTWLAATEAAELEMDRLVMEGLAGRPLEKWDQPYWYWAIRPMRRL